MEKTNLISVIIPVFNEQDNIKPLYQKLKSEISRLKHEIIYIDDGSKDNTSKIITELKKKDNSVELIRFRKNFGKSEALSSGFKNAKGSIVITMDGDLQDDPKDIHKFLEKLNSGYDLVVGWKQKKYRWYNLKFIPSKIFNILTNTLTGIKLHDIDCPFKAFKREVTNEITIYGELHRYIPVLVHQKGFKIGEVKIKNLARKSGKSKFGSGRIVKGFLDLITVLFLTRFITRPLHFFGSLGLLLFIPGLILGITLVIIRFGFNITITQQDFVLATILLVILGVQFISLGLVGEMINLHSMERNKGLK